MRRRLEQYCENGHISMRLTRAKIGKLLTNRFTRVESKSCIQEDSKVKADRTYKITLSFTPTYTCRGKKMKSKLILRCLNYSFRRGGYDLFKETLCEDVLLHDEIGVMCDISAD